MSRKRIVLGKVQVGDILPVLPIPITSSLIVSGAIASRQAGRSSASRQAALHVTQRIDSRST